MSPFERYQPPASSRRPEGATVTITQRGAINLSPDAHHLLGKPFQVELLWDREAQILGIEPTAHTSPGALRLLATKQARTISAKTFLDWAGIDYSVARRRPAELDDGVLIVDLSEPGDEVSSNRSKIIV